MPVMAIMLVVQTQNEKKRGRGRRRASKQPVKQSRATIKYKTRCHNWKKSVQDIYVIARKRRQPIILENRNKEKGKAKIK